MRPMWAGVIAGVAVAKAQADINTIKAQKRKVSRHDIAGILVAVCLDQE